MLDAHLIAKTRPLAPESSVVRFGTFRVTVLADRLFRIEEDSTEEFCDEATQAIWFRDLPSVPFSVTRKNGALQIKTDAVTLVLKKTIAESTVKLDGKRVPLDGRGNLHGTYSTLDRCLGDLYCGDKFGSEEGKTKIHLADGVLSETGVALYDDSASLVLGQDGHVYPRAHAETDLYVFAFGHDYRSAIRALYRLCGPVPQIPRFAFGNWWSRYHAYDEREYLRVLDHLAESDVPLTVATIDMDWHWSTTLDEKKHIRELGKYGDFYGNYSGWTGYSWNTDLFPDYRRFLQRIHDRNLHITMNLHPGSGVRWFEDMYPEMARAVGIDPKTEQYVEFDVTSDAFLNAYFKVLHKPYEHDGVDFWWIDWQQGKKSALEGLDPLWSLNHYHTLDIAKESPHPMILSRYSGVGAHRYPLGFSGDTYVTWESLDYIPYFTATASNIGYTFWSHDIGGHMHGFKDNELYVRYVQFGVFSPINRLHCTSTEVCTKEPFVYMNGTGAIAERFLRLRHRMIPFLYSAAIETSRFGKALIEPMYYEYPEERDAYLCGNEYFFGGQLLVRPITKKGDAAHLCATKVWLPRGRWTDIFTGDEYEGGRTVEMVRFLDSMPVLAKEGAFFVLDGRTHGNACDEPDTLRILATNGSGTYTLREDSGDTVFASVGEENRQSVTVTAGAGVRTRSMTFEFRNIKAGTVHVTADGTESDFTSDDDGCLSVVLPAVQSGVSYRISVSFEEDRRAKRNERFFASLQRFENENDENSCVYRMLCPLSDEECRAAISERESLTKNQKKRLLEEIEP